MESLKGVVLHSSDYTRIVKKAEKEAEAGRILDEVERLFERYVDGDYGLTNARIRQLRGIRMTSDELTGDYLLAGVEG